MNVTFFQKPIKVDIWLDILCPWCWITKFRFEKAWEEFEYKNQVEINYYFIRVGKNINPITFKEYLLYRLGSNIRVEKELSKLSDIMLLENINCNLDSIKYGDTLDALILLLASKNINKDMELLNQIYLMSMVKGEYIFDKKVLLKTANKAGIEKDFVIEALQKPVYKYVVQNNYIRLKNMGVEKIPLLVFNDKFFYSGVREVVFFKEILFNMYKKYNN
ncbi:DsbA family protein [Acinetobacter lactucae]|uniref:DsbA family protein n=1 Tax=Acinetobacter lactucae TaxID=1785128 RepID=UPI00358DABA7